MNGPSPQFNGEGIGFAIDSASVAPAVQVLWQGKVKRSETPFLLYRGLGQGARFLIIFQKLSPGYRFCSWFCRFCRVSTKNGRKCGGQPQHFMTQEDVVKIFLPWREDWQPGAKAMMTVQ